MRLLISALLTLALSVAPSMARAGDADQEEEQDEPRHTVRDFLYVDWDFWGAYGVRFVKNGEEGGPGFLALGVGAAVEGSETAERHASHATAWATANFLFGLLTAGLLVADILTYPDNHAGNLSGWPEFVPPRGGSSQNAILGLGWLLSIAFGSTARFMAYEEIMQSVNAYNADLAAGKLIHETGATAVAARSPAVLAW